MNSNTWVCWYCHAETRRITDLKEHPWRPDGWIGTGVWTFCDQCTKPPDNAVWDIGRIDGKLVKRYSASQWEMTQPDHVVRLPFDLMIGSKLESPAMTFEVVGCKPDPACFGWVIELEAITMHAHTIDGERL